MGIRSSVFDSNAEHTVFKALESRWSPSYKLFAQLPLAKIFTMQSGTSEEREFFLKTNVDYTLCNQDGKPLLSVEFDGIGQGYSKDGKYIAVQDVESDPFRKKKLDYKLARANATRYPFFVVSFDETKSLEVNESLTILDGIIATIVTRYRSKELMQEFIRDYRETYGRDPDDEETQTIVTDAETLADLELDPFEKTSSRIAFDLEDRLQVLRSVNVKTYSIPPVPDTKGDWMSLEFLESLKIRHKALKEANLHGARVVVSLKGNHPTVMRDVSIRAVGDWSTALSLAERIAKYLALKQAYELQTSSSLPPS